MPLALGTGGVLVSSRSLDRLQRALGVTMIGAAFLIAQTARADETVMVEDNSRVACMASEKDLTRISLIGDEFASVSKVQPTNPLDDFSVVNEPTRGDIYLSVPEGFRLKLLSFFGTTKKGYVYKFGCRIEAIEAQQIFVSNPLAMAKTEAVTESEEAAPDADETAVRLIQAMASKEIVPGYRMRRSALVPVQAGDLTVQLVAEYEGLDVVGRVVRIENSSSAPVEITEGRIAPADALAVSIANPKLAPRQATSAYVVTRKEGS